MSAASQQRVNRKPLRLTGLPLHSVALTLAMGAALPAQTPSAGGPAADREAIVRALVQRMTLAEKIGQMTQADHQFLHDPSDVSRYFLGSLLNGGNSDPKGGNSFAEWRRLPEMYQREAMRTRLRIPLLYGLDVVHGNSNVVGAVIFPHNIGLGATRDAALVQRVTEVAAAEERAIGANWAFAPCVCIPRDIRWGRTYEGFSEDPAIVSTMGAAAVRGFQGGGLDTPALRGSSRVAASAKHFLGDGGTLAGTGINKMVDRGNTLANDVMLRQLYLAPYRAAVAAGVATIMPSYSSWNGIKVSGDHHLLTDILKGELGFRGFLISDYDAVDEVHPDYKVAIATAINAGIDMVMVPQRFALFIDLLTELVNEGRVPMSRIDDAVTRILRVKQAMGLLDPSWDARPDPALARSFGSAEHRQVARQAVRQSLVLLKNSGGALPIAASARHIHVMGKSADDIGNQSGGWTISWQGKSGPVTTGGTTVLEAIRRAAGPGTLVTTAPRGPVPADADVVVAVIGEKPYAEMNGDRMDLSLDADDRAVVASARATRAKVVVVLVSGRPMVLGDVLAQADAVVAAWLPGTEGDGVADVLFGTYLPTGRLSFSWPRTMEDVPGWAAYMRGPLFPVGFGLTYPGERVLPRQ